MGSASFLAAATKGSLPASVTPLLAVAILLGLVAAGAALLWAAASSAHARSLGDTAGRLRALDELVTQGSITPEEYARQRAALLTEI